jgi:signal transduction histidine kinase
MQAVAVGSGCIGLVLLMAGLANATPGGDVPWAELSALVGLASGVCYFVGFAPPTWLRRAWQEPELRSFLRRAASLPRLPDTHSVVVELERGAAASLGAPGASIGLWNPVSHRLTFFYNPPTHAKGASDLPPDTGTFSLHDNMWDVDPTNHPISGRVFLEQRPRLFMDIERVDPLNRALYRAYDARSALVAPITAGDQHLGVLLIYAPRAPIFANSDLELVQLLADQAAVILESRALIDEAAGVRAREQATRLKDDFLSSAAHDLKTPLTGLVIQAQLLQRRADRDPAAPVDRVGLDRLLQQSLRLRDLVLELLDAARLEQGRLIGELSDVELGALLREVVEREDANWKRVELDIEGPVVAHVDGPRIEQVITNLVENGLKYSPDGGPVRVRLWSEEHEARLSVTDLGIGVGAEDRELIFERFHRGQNVDDRRFAGMGLGLYITRGIVEQHGGRIWVESSPGHGSTFHVALPLRPALHVDPEPAGVEPERGGLERAARV